MKVVMLLRGPLWLLGLVLVLVLEGCGLAPVEQERPVNQVIKAADRAPPVPQWVQFGVVEWVTPTTLERGGDDAEAAMNLNIRLDTGEEMTVVQAVSQAGRFEVGDRVRLLQIGDFTRITYWPYASRSTQGESSSRLPESETSE